MRAIRALVTAAMITGAATATACGRSAAPYDAGSAQPAARAITVSVKNDNMLAMDLYAVTADHSTRLGAVEPGMSDTMVLDPSFLPNGFVEIVARPVGGGRPVSTGSLNPMPGQTIDFEIGFNLSDSRATIR